MDAWIALARGPLFRVSLAVCLLGLALRVGLELYRVVWAWRQAGDKDLPTAMVLRTTVGWLLPVRLLHARPLYSLLSLLFHVGIILVPLFFAGHVALWQESFPLAWPTLPHAAADVLTLATAVAIVGLLGARFAAASSRALTGIHDVGILGLLLAVAVSGWLAAHPRWAGVDARSLVLVHVLAGNAALLLAPFSKIVHCVLAPFSQLVFELGWHFPAATGRHVAVVLGKEGEGV